MNIPGLGSVTEYKDMDGWLVSEPIEVPVLGGKKCWIILEDYEVDSDKESFHVAIANFLNLTESALKEVEIHLFHYYKDMEEFCKEYNDDFKLIESPDQVWQRIHLGSEPMVTRRAYGDKGIYISLTCSCDWEEEHGLQIVFKNGLRINKVGSFDGHLTNSDTWGDESLEEVIYRSEADGQGC